MRSLRLARHPAATEHERLVYEGWLLYDTGHCEEALQKADESISIQRSFEAFTIRNTFIGSVISEIIHLE
jgi:hypothetical protein